MKRVDLMKDKEEFRLPRLPRMEKVGGQPIERFINVGIFLLLMRGMNQRDGKRRGEEGSHM